jgi:cell division protein FtsI (penicillin-binding protein 3)
MKPFLFAAALEEGVLSPDTMIDCEQGRYKVADRYITDHHPRGWLKANEVLRYSSNIGAAKVGQALGTQNYHRYLTALGFDEKPGLELPGQGKGLLRPASQWTSVDLAAGSFGQGFAVTAAQMAKAYLCLANHGETRPLTLLRDPAPQSRASRRVFSRETADTVLSMMLEVVQDDGTADNVRIPGVPMAGKTGTAQKAEQGGYGDKHLASFVGLVPGDDPELLILAMVDEPGPVFYGGLVAAPVVRDLAVNALAYRGEMPTAMAMARQQGEQGGRQTPADVTHKVLRTPAGTASANVPDLKGLPVRRAMEVLVGRGIVPVLKGRGMAVSRQEPAAGAPWPKGGDDVFVLWLS